MIGICEDLRKSVLQAAIQGKLTEQLESDGNAETLYAEIQQEKQRLIKEGKIKKEKELEPIDLDEIPFDIPDNWKWVKLATIFDVRDGTHDTPKYVDKGIPLVTSKNLEDGKINFVGAKLISETDASEINKRSQVEESNILFAMIGTIGNPVIVHKDREFCIKNMALFKAYNLSLTSMNYLFIVLTIVQEQMKTIASGGVQSFVSLSFLRNYLFPLPPLAEQHRIVAKVDELMSKIDEMEKTEKSLTDLYNAFPGDMNASLLQAAIQGKLTEQLESDGNAETLYAEIQQEKQRLIKEGKIKKEKALELIDPDEVPFDIPDNWKWVRLGNITKITMGQSPSGNNVADGGDGVEFHQGKIYFGEEYLKQSKQTTSEITKKAEPNSVLLCVRAPVGKVNILDREICIGRGLCAISAFAKMDVRFLYFWLKSFEQDFIDKSTGSTFKAITCNIVENELFPLPPLAEQKRIVERLDQLLPLCDKIKDSIQE